MSVPPLKPLHRDDQLIDGKLKKFERACTEKTWSTRCDRDKKAA